MPFRMLAIDADGTLLDPEGTLTSAVRNAIFEARNRGLQVVLCTGRRFRTTRRIARELSLEGPMVVQNGALVKDSQSGATLERNTLSEAIYRPAVALLRTVGAPLAYVDDLHDGIDIISEPASRGHTFQTAYVEANAQTTRIVESLEDLAPEGVCLLSCMADAESLKQLELRIATELGAQVRTHFLDNKSYAGHILEIASPEAGKWPALERLAMARGIDSSEILAIGDDENDAEMIANAGCGVAMGNAVDSVREAADFITSANSEDGVCLAIQRFVLDG
jgi:Cof subfamily protein (haloacid dehalogenase superfamily)